MYNVKKAVGDQSRLIVDILIVAPLITVVGGDAIGLYYDISFEEKRSDLIQTACAKSP